MPIVEIPDKKMVIEFPDTMTDEEIERAIYTDIYDQPVISKAPEPSAYQRLKDYVTPTKPTIGRPISKEEEVAFEPADIEIPTQPIQKKATLDLTEPEQLEPEALAMEGIETPGLEMINKMVKDSLFGELPAGIGYLQKPLEEAADYWGKYTMSEEEEMAMARKYPNLMAARYAAASILLPGVSQYFASTVDWKEFQKKSIEEQRLEILGTTGAYVVFGAGIRWGVQGLARLAKSYPWMTKPIMRLLKESTWFRRMTNKERGLTLQTVNQMKEAGLADAQILKNLRNRNRTEYKAYFDEAVRTRGLGPAEEGRIVRPTKPIVPPSPKEAPPDFNKMQTDLDKGKITIDDLIIKRDAIAKTYPELVDPINQVIIDKKAETLVPEPEVEPEPPTEVKKGPTIEERITAIEETAKVEKEAIRKEFEEKKAKVAEEAKVADITQWEKDFKEIAHKVIKAEKDIKGEPLTPKQQRLLERINLAEEKGWEAFSKARGYTKQEIEDYRKYLGLIKKGKALGLQERISSIQIDALKPWAKAEAKEASWEKFEPNEYGYQAREVEGLKKDYFVAQEDAETYQIIESEKGSTKAQVKKTKEGKYKFQGYWSEPKERPAFHDTGYQFDTPQKAILQFNKYQDAIEKPYTVALDEYKKYGGKEQGHRNSVAEAIKQDKIKSHPDYPELTKVEPKKAIEPVKAKVPKKILPEHGKGISYKTKIKVEETGEVVEVTMDAERAIMDVNAKIDAYRKLIECIG